MKRGIKWCLDKNVEWEKEAKENSEMKEINEIKKYREDRKNKILKSKELRFVNCKSKIEKLKEIEIKAKKRAEERSKIIEEDLRKNSQNEKSNKQYSQQDNEIKLNDNKNSKSETKDTTEKRVTIEEKSKSSIKTNDDASPNDSEYEDLVQEDEIFVKEKLGKRPKVEPRSSILYRRKLEPKSLVWSSMVDRMETDRKVRIESGEISTFKATKEKFVAMSEHDKKKLEKEMAKEEEKETAEDKVFIKMCEDNKPIIQEILSDYVEHKEEEDDDEQPEIGSPEVGQSLEGLPTNNELEAKEEE